jgi:nicotinate-nucleotide--dimethylbenzimidazole phosphoribosyltransferase
MTDLLQLPRLDHVAIHVADRDEFAQELVHRFDMHVIERTERFTLIGADASHGKITLLDKLDGDGPDPVPNRIVSLVLAEAAGATVRVADIAVDVDEPHSASIGAHKVRRGSGNIAVEDALTADEAQAAVEAGRRIADEEVDAGADLLIAGDMGIGNTTAATALIAALTGAEPVVVVGRGTGIDDAGWSRKVAAVRDALYRARGLTADPVGLLRVCGGADLAAMAGFCAQAAVRQTPVLLDGVVVTSAAMVADVLAPGARDWWRAGHRSTEPAHTLALEKLGLEPIVDLSMRLGEGTGAAVALPVVRASIATLRSMATFDEASVSS